MNIRSSSLPPLALIAGPTASGKSTLAMMLAEARNGVIINADSAQVYRDLRIVSARPDEADQARAPHLLYGYRDAADPCSAADWAAEAAQAISDVQRQGRLPILVGGTGLYIRTLLDGIAPVPPIEEEIRAAVRVMNVADAHAALLREDLEAASRLRPSDTTRVARALEVVRSTGRPLRDWQKEKIGGIGDQVSLIPLLLLPPRPWLYGRCDRRFEQMLGKGAIDEVRCLRMRGLDPALPVMRAIGVAEIGMLIDGQLSRAETIAAGCTATRQYAKRQYTWFSRQPPASWKRVEEELGTESLQRLTAEFPNG